MILPIHGEVAAARAADGGGFPLEQRLRPAPSTSLRLVPLPVNGEDL